MEGITQRHEYQEVEIMEGQLRVCPPQAHTKKDDWSECYEEPVYKGMGKIKRKQQGHWNMPGLEQQPQGEGEGLESESYDCRRRVAAQQEMQLW